MKSRFITVICLVCTFKQTQGLIINNGIETLTQTYCTECKHEFYILPESHITVIA